MKRLLILSAALAAVALTGCQTIKEEKLKYDGREETVTNVIGNVWRIDATWPHVKQSRPMAEYLYEKARSFCDREKMGMLPLSGSTEDGSGDAAKPAKGWLEFRCQRGVKVETEYKGIFFKLDPDDLLGDDEK